MNVSVIMQKYARQVVTFYLTRTFLTPAIFPSRTTMFLAFANSNFSRLFVTETFLPVLTHF